MQDFDDLILGHVYFPVADLNGAAKPEQAKEVDVTANGTQTVVPDSGYALSSVTINTNVPAPAIETQEKSITIAQNGASEVTPDAGKYLSKVSITTNVPQITTQVKSVEITTNGETAITPDEGYGAMTQVNLNVAVPLPENKLPSVVDKSVTEITADDLGDITSIGLYAFYDCQNLTSITIPASVTAIGDHALQCGSTTNQVTITMLGETPPTIQTNTMQYDNIAQIIVPTGTGDTYKAATIWSNYAAKIVEVGGGGVTYDPVFANNSWAQIKQAFDNDEVPETWAIGDTKEVELTDGNTYHIRLSDMQKGRYNKVGGGTTKAGFEFVECLPTAYAINPSQVTDGDVTAYTAGGWAMCYMKNTVLDQTVWNMLPADLQAVISEITLNEYSYSAPSPRTSNNKLFLFAYTELSTSSGDSAEGNEEGCVKYTLWDYYLSRQSNSDRVKYKVNQTSTTYWWLRSPIAGNIIYWCPILDAGSFTNNRAAASVYGCAPVFAI